MSDNIHRLIVLVAGSLNPPRGPKRIAVALGFGFLVHSVFVLAVLAMIVGMYFGMSRGLGSVPWPYAFVANTFLLLQFPFTHSVLLTERGSRWLSRLIPGQLGTERLGTILSTTNYAVIASFQLLLLFAFWTPSGIVWWQAEGVSYYTLMCCYALSWLLLMKASFDAGAEVQSGALGWMSLLQNIKPVFPDMPTTGLFRVIRQPIYVAFTLTLWTVPTWTPDQLVLAITLSTYCLSAPLLKERRFQKQYGERFAAYKRRTPYAIPFTRTKPGDPG